LIEIGSKTAEKNSAQTNKQTDRHYENNGHLAVNQYRDDAVCRAGDLFAFSAREEVFSSSTRRTLWLVQLCLRRKPRRLPASLLQV